MASEPRRRSCSTMRLSLTYQGAALKKAASIHLGNGQGARAVVHSAQLRGTLANTSSVAITAVALRPRRPAAAPHQFNTLSSPCAISKSVQRKSGFVESGPWQGSRSTKEANPQWEVVPLNLPRVTLSRSQPSSEAHCRGGASAAFVAVPSNPFARTTQRSHAVFLAEDRNRLTGGQFMLCRLPR